MILREPPEIAYLREQEQREQEQDQMDEAWGHDALALGNGQTLGHQGSP